MIQVIVKKKDDDIIGFHIEGHSGYADRGSDIVCAAISALAINCLNSIDEFTDDSFSVGRDPELGMLDLELTETVSEQSELLLQSLYLGVRTVSESYGDQYVRLIHCHEEKE